MASASPRRILLTFADSRMRRSLDRIRRQAGAMDAYDEIRVHDESSFDRDFLADFGHLARPGVRGYGYWCWKPHLVLRTLLETEPGTLVHWVDAGCWLRPSGRARLLEYFDAASRAPEGILAFQARRDPDMDASLEGFRLPERRWTKADLLESLGVRGDASILDSNQIEATTFFVRNGPGTLELARRWSGVFAKDAALVDDSPSRLPEDPQFLGHRHDQSVFSILVKLHGAHLVSAFETYRPLVDGERLPHQYRYTWKGMDCFPVWAKRDKDLGLVGGATLKIRRILSKLERLATGKKGRTAW